jgi:hypothetical protein
MIPHNMKGIANTCGGQLNDPRIAKNRHAILKEGFKSVSINMTRKPTNLQQHRRLTSSNIVADLPPHLFFSGSQSLVVDGVLRVHNKIENRG